MSTLSFVTVPGTALWNSGLLRIDFQIHQHQASKNWRISIWFYKSTFKRSVSQFHKLIHLLNWNCGMIIVFNPYCATGIRGPWMLKARGFPRPSVQCTLRSCRARRHGTHIKQVLRGNHGHVRRQPWGSQHSTFRWVLVGCIGIPGRAGLGASFCSRSTHFKRLILFL